MNARTLACTALLGLAALTGCSNSSDDAQPADCKTALQREYDAHADQSTYLLTESNWPDDCDGIDPATVNNYVAAILGEGAADEMNDHLDDNLQDQEDALDDFLDTTTDTP